MARLGLICPFEKYRHTTSGQSERNFDNCYRRPRVNLIMSDETGMIKTEKYGWCWQDSTLSDMFRMIE